MPRQNERDLHDVPEVLRNELVYHFVDDVDEVLALAMGIGVFRAVATAAEASVATS